MSVKGMSGLVAYFSRKGFNYVRGSIVDLLIGNTEVAARVIQELTGSDTFRIAPAVEYPAGYEETTEVARQELVPTAAEARCELSNVAAPLLDLTQKKRTAIRADLAAVKGGNYPAALDLIKDKLLRLTVSIHKASRPPAKFILANCLYRNERPFSRLRVRNPG